MVDVRTDRGGRAEVEADRGEAAEEQQRRTRELARPRTPVQPADRVAVVGAGATDEQLLHGSGHHPMMPWDP